MNYPEQLIKLIQVLRRFPGVGTKSAERFAFQMLEWPEHQVREMATVIQALPDKIDHCSSCGCLKDVDKCHFCDGQRANAKVLCIVSSPRDVYSIEETGEYRGHYHVMGALLSPMEGIGPEQLTVAPLKERIQRLEIEEVIIALDSTLEGDATSLFLKEELEPLNVTISRLAFGLPMGSSLDYVDGGTLARAFSGRGHF